MTRRMTAGEIADDIAARIESGEYPPGGRLPSYSQIGELYSVHYATAHRVMLILKARGLVYGEPGRGTFVRGSEE